MIYSRIVASGGFLPDNIVTNSMLEKCVDTSDEWIVSRTGIKARHIANASDLTSDLACKAAEQALSEILFDRNTIDLIIVATTTPDMVFPSTACIIQEKLNLQACPAFDVQAVCAGFIYALATADAYIRCGLAHRALVIGAETMSHLIDWNDRSTCVLFGDGAGAVVLEAAEKPGIRHSKLAADGRYQNILKTNTHISDGKIQGHPYLYMDGPAVFKFAVKALSNIALQTLQEAGLTQSSIDWLVPHQANLRIIEATAKHLKMPMEKVIVTLANQANTSAASIPLALNSAIRDGRIKSGQNLLLEGIGGGFAWGAVLLTY